MAYIYDMSYFIDYYFIVPPPPRRGGAELPPPHGGGGGSLWELLLVPFAKGGEITLIK